jgi:hypothetical protein
MRHRFHSICPYFAMFPETFAEEWIDKLTRRGELVLDPFAGRGTAPFQALLMGRRAVGADINPVAACLNIAKLETPSRSAIAARLTHFESMYDETAWVGATEVLPIFFHHAFNRSVLAQLLFLREKLKWKINRTDAFIASLAMGALHGEASSSRYLSNQMPRTISTKPDYSVRFWTDRRLVAPERDVFAVLRSALDFRFSSNPPELKGKAFLGDMRGLPRLWTGDGARLVLTSPPYGAVTSYEEDQWLRLWLLGGPSRPGKASITRDDRRHKPEDYWRFIGDFWRSISLVCLPRAHVVVRVGTSALQVENLASSFEASSMLSPRKVKLISSTTSVIKKRQTEAFRPGSKGLGVELDLHFSMT